MKKENLIRLGVAAQKKFNIAAEFDVYIQPSGTPTHVRLPVPDKHAFMGYGVDDIYLETWVSVDGNEAADVGYAPRAKILIVRFRDKFHD